MEGIACKRAISRLHGSLMRFVGGSGGQVPHKPWRAVYRPVEPSAAPGAQLEPLADVPVELPAASGTQLAPLAAPGAQLAVPGALVEPPVHGAPVEPSAQDAARSSSSSGAADLGWSAFIPRGPPRRNISTSNQA